MHTDTKVTDVASLLRELIDGQARIIALLERGRGARDQADVVLIAAIAETLGHLTVTSPQVMAHRAASADLRDAIEATDITTAQELGCLFRRLEGVPVGGYRLERVKWKTCRIAGYLRAVPFRPPSHRAW